MFIIAHHFIQDPNVFWAEAAKVNDSIPEGITLHSVYPSQDMKTGTCVWEAESVSVVQNLLDRVVGKVSKNTCYEVNEEMATGLPQKVGKEKLTF